MTTISRLDHNRPTPTRVPCAAAQLSYDIYLPDWMLEHRPHFIDDAEMNCLASLADFASGPSTGRQAARLLAELFRLPWPCTPSLHPLTVVFRDGRCVRLLRTLRGHRDCQSLVNLETEN